MADERLTARDRLLGAAGYGDAEIRPLAADASFRRYDRVTRPGGQRAVLMDAPPGKEDVRPFQQIANVLAGWGLSAPAVLAADPEQGFLLLEDLGDDLFSHLIRKGHDEAELYAAAIDTLPMLQANTPPGTIPPYDLELLLQESALLLDWRFPDAIGREPSAEERAAWQTAWRAVLDGVAGDRSVLVLRDYHVDNLIWLPDRQGVQRTGLLDFQDAVRGHPAYDVASLLSDVRRDVPTEIERAMLARFIAATGADEAAFMADYAVLAAQRNTKILGIFTRLSKRDGKHGYLKWLPRTWRLLRRDLAHPALEPVARWFDNHLPHDPAEDSRPA